VIQPKFAWVVVLALIAAGACAKRPEAVKRYALSGKVVSTDVKASQLVVNHKAIPGFMEAMIMPYRVKDASSLQSLAPGDEIAADVVVQGSDYWLENIRVTKKNTGAKPQALEFRMPQSGEEVPDFTLQSRETAERTHLLRVSFDLAHDTPAALRKYAGTRAATGSRTRSCGGGAGAAARRIESGVPDRKAS